MHEKNMGETMRNRSLKLQWVFRTTFFAAAVIVFAAMSIVAKATSNQIDIVSLSSRPDIVSGEVVLAQVTVPSGVALSDVYVFLNGQNVTKRFQAIAGGRSLMGLVQGLDIGQSDLTAVALDKKNQPYLTGRLALTDYPIAGPIFSGPHEKPFYCMTQLFPLPASTKTLGPALDTDCSTATRIDYVYKTTGGVFKPLPSRTVYPADLARTTTSQGKTVPYIVRVENRHDQPGHLRDGDPARSHERGAADIF